MTMLKGRKERRSGKKSQLKKDISEHKFLFFVYLVIRLLVIAVMIVQLTERNVYNVFLCILSLILFLIPSFVEKHIKIDVPDTLEVIILLFIFSAEILGEISSYYLTFPYWDTMLHTINGFLCAAIGFALIDILNNSERFAMKLSPFFVVLCSFCFAMTIGVIWEFFEYFMDTFFHTDMQKDTIISAISSVLLNPEGKNSAVTVTVESVKLGGITFPGYIDIGLIDTMADLFVNFIGALVFSVCGFFYVKNRGKYRFIRHFLLKKKDYCGKAAPIAKAPSAEEEEKKQ
jgi:hypothetical protein